MIDRLIKWLTRSRRETEAAAALRRLCGAHRWEFTDSSAREMIFTEFRACRCGEVQSADALFKWVGGDPEWFSVSEGVRRVVFARACQYWRAHGFLNGNENESGSH